jgi:hypothetical protein
MSFLYNRADVDRVLWIMSRSVTMLRISQLKAVAKLTQALGQRRFGHFDHNAHAATGPFASSSLQFSESAAVADNELSVEALVKTADVATGQPLFGPAPVQTEKHCTK